MNWQGRVHDENLPEGRAEAVVEIGSGVLTARIQNETQSKYEFNLHGGFIEFGGLDHDTLYIRSQSQKDPVLVIRDNSFIAALSELNIPEIQQILNAGSGKRKKRKLGSILGWGIALVFFVSIFFTSLGTNIIVSLIPTSLDETIGEMSFEAAVASMNGQYLPVKNEMVTEAMEIIRKRLEGGIENKKFKYHIEVFESKLVNAVCLPGGYIAAFSGLIEEAQSAEELAGVIAHEMMHAEKRHGMKQIIRRLGFFLGLQIIFSGSEGLLEMVADGAAVIASLDYSRSMETQADEEGVLVMVRAKISPLGLASFFEKLSSEKEANEKSLSNEPEESLDSEESDESDFNLSWLSTHPDTVARIANIKSIYEKHDDVDYRSIKVNWKALQAAFK
ncbi:MAG: M48 family metallopeptidase [Leptospirales bacterium]